MNLHLRNPPMQQMIQKTHRTMMASVFLVNIIEYMNNGLDSLYTYGFFYLNSVYNSLGYFMNFIPCFVLIFIERDRFELKHLTASVVNAIQSVQYQLLENLKSLAMGDTLYSFMSL